jgi:TRAP-type uncharacterized transport system fused permease subunit
VPFVFVLDPAGVALLLKAPAGISWLQVAWIAITACIGIAALAAGAQNWMFRACRLWERVVLVVAGLALIYPAPAADAIGLAGVALVAVAQWLSRRRGAAA